MSEEEIEERDALYLELSQRSISRGSITATAEIRILIQSGSLDAMRFFVKHWNPGIHLHSVRCAYNGATSLSQDPMTFITDDHIRAIQTFHEHAFHGIPQRSDINVITPFYALVLKHYKRVDFIISLVVERGIHSSDELAGILDASEDHPAPLTGGIL